MAGARVFDGELVVPDEVLSVGGALELGFALGIGGDGEGVMGSLSMAR